MSYWTLESKADIGLRVFSNNLSNLFKETSLGMLQLLTSNELNPNINGLVRHTSEWNISIDNDGFDDYESLMITWLEEILYRLEVHEEFLIDCQCRISKMEQKLLCESQVSWVKSDQIIRDFEIKAVTSHEFTIRKLKSNESELSNNPNIPEMIGPGWICNVLFDI